MKRNTVIFIKTTSLVLAFMLLLGGGIMFLSFSHSGVKPNNSNFLTPDLAITAPTSQELLQKKFNAYNTVTEENGKSVVTIFSEEQIKDFNNRRNNGEWFWLSSEEMLFLINNTVELFKTYDIVYIRDLDGNLNKYYGLSFFSSEEYYASFNGFDLGVTDASFDLKKDIYETIFKRVEVLNSAVYNTVANSNECRVFSDISQALTQDEENIIKNNLNPWYLSQTEESKSIILWRFYNENIHYWKNTDLITQSDLSIGNSWEKRTTVYSKESLPNTIGTDKYDKHNGETAVIELYNESTQEIIARLHFDESNNPEQIASVHNYLKSVINNTSNSNNTAQTTDYRVVIYLNGFSTQNDSDIAIRYCPDGNIDLFSYTSNDDAFQNNFWFLKGARPLTEYINQLLSDQLAKQ